MQQCESAAGCLSFAQAAPVCIMRAHVAHCCSLRPAAVLINYDPNGDGTSNGDFQLALSLTGAPEISLPFGYSIE